MYFPHKQKQSTERCRWTTARPVPQLPSPYLQTVHKLDSRIIAPVPLPSLKKKEVDRPYSGTLPKPQPANPHPRPPKPCHSGTKRPGNTALVKEAPFTSSPRVSPPPPPCKPGGPRKRFLAGRAAAARPCGPEGGGGQPGGKGEGWADHPAGSLGGLWPGGLSAPGARSRASQGALFLGEREETRGQSYYSAVKPLSFKEFHQNSPRIMFAQCLLSFGPVFPQTFDLQGYAAFWLFASGGESGSE